MQILHILELNGPNIWANYPCAEALVDLGAFEEKPSNKIPGFTERLVAWLPGLIEHRCSIGERGGFIKRLEDGTWLGHVLEHVSIELHSRSHLPVGFGRARETGEYGVYRVAIECADPKFGVACLETGHGLVMAAVEGRAFDVEAAVRHLADVANLVCLGPGTRAIVGAAKARGIPAIRLTEGNLVQLEYGKPQRRIWTAETDRTGAVAEGIAQDKQLTRKLLSSVGIPVTAGRDVSSAEDAWEAAQELGLPVVVKPGDGNHGRGVSIRLSDAEEIRAAYGIAAKEGSTVVVERFVPGAQYRVLVVGNRAIAASGGQAETVVGDGVRSIRDLVAIANQDIRRGDFSVRPLSVLLLDAVSIELLRRQGLQPDSVPSAGRTVTLHHNGDLVVDVTDRMHPEVAARCVLAAQTVGLDIAGMDIIAEDIGQPLESQGGAIIEVNASPALVPHLAPLAGTPRPVGEAIVDLLFPNNRSKPMPLVAVSGTEGRTEVAEAIATLFEGAGRATALAGAHGLRAEGRVIQPTDATDSASARRALMNPYIDAAVLEVSEASVLKEGLGFDRCDLAIVTKITEREPFGDRFRWGPPSVWKAVRSPLDLVTKEGAAILAADDPEVMKMAEHCEGEVILFGPAGAAPLEDHLKRGGRAVVEEGPDLVLLEGFRRERIETTESLAGLAPGFRAAIFAAALYLGISTTQAS